MIARPNIVELLARRAGRTVFGLVMIAGAGALVRGAIGEHLGAREILGVTWVTAIVAGVVTWIVAHFFAHRWRTDALKYAGLVAPTIGLALVTPLSVHLLVALAAHSSDGFDGWVRMSLVITGAAHLAFALTATIRVTSLIDGRRPLSVAYVYMIVVMVSCVPFVALILPPILVAVTGFLMLPILYLPERIVARERAVFDAAPPIAYVRA